VWVRPASRDVRPYGRCTMAAKKGPVEKAVKAVADTTKKVAKAVEKKVVKPVAKAVGLAKPKKAAPKAAASKTAPKKPAAKKK
jgi:hypothetical protein